VQSVSIENIRKSQLWVSKLHPMQRIRIQQKTTCKATASSLEDPSDLRHVSKNSIVRSLPGHDQPSVSGFRADFDGLNLSPGPHRRERCDLALNSCLSPAGAGGVCAIDRGATLKLLGNISIPAHTTVDCQATFPDAEDANIGQYASLPSLLRRGSDIDERQQHPTGRKQQLDDSYGDNGNVPLLHRNRSCLRWFRGALRRKA